MIEHQRPATCPLEMRDRAAPMLHESDRRCDSRRDTLPLVIDRLQRTVGTAWNWTERVKSLDDLDMNCPKPRVGSPASRNRSFPKSNRSRCTSATIPWQREVSPDD